MKIIIAGDGKVGANLTRKLSAEGYDITLIDTNGEVLEQAWRDTILWLLMEIVP